MIILDTSGLLAGLVSHQRGHEECMAVLAEAQVPLLISPLIVAEVDYMITKYSSVERELDFLQEIVNGVYRMVDFSVDDIAEAREVASRYRQLDIGLADASIVVLSRKYNTLDLLTLDHRHFRALRGARGRPFRILP